MLSKRAMKWVNYAALYIQYVLKAFVNSTYLQKMQERQSQPIDTLKDSGPESTTIGTFGNHSSSCNFFLLSGTAVQCCRGHNTLHKTVGPRRMAVKLLSYAKLSTSRAQRCLLWQPTYCKALRGDASLRCSQTSLASYAVKGHLHLHLFLLT